MDIDIVWACEVTAINSWELDKLAHDLELDSDVTILRQKAPQKPGQKDSGLIIGLTIAGLVISSIDTLFNILSYRLLKTGKYSASFELDGSTYTVEGYSAEDISRMRNEIIKLNPPRLRIQLLNK